MIVGYSDGSKKIVPEEIKALHMLANMADILAMRSRKTIATYIKAPQPKPQGPISPPQRDN